MSATEPTILDDLEVRTFQHQDQPAIAHLYTQGLFDGEIAPNDTGADIENVQEAYFNDDRHHLWVAVHHGRIVGMVAVTTDEDHTAEIRRLRVEPDLQHTNVAPRLIEQAIAHCKVHNFLKVRFDTRFHREAAVNMFDRIGFQHTRSRTVHGQELLEFYLDIYRQERND